jgi:hypothetical protein
MYVGMYVCMYVCRFPGGSQEVPEGSREAGGSREVPGRFPGGSWRTPDHHPYPEALRPPDKGDDVFYLFLQKQKSAQSYIPKGYFPPYEAV